MLFEKGSSEIQMTGGFAHEMRNALAGTGMLLHTILQNEKSLCEANPELLGQLFEAVEPYLPDDQKASVLALFAKIDKNEESLDRVLRLIKQHIDRALEISKLLLSYAELGQSQVERKPISLQQLLQQLVQEHQQVFAEQGIALSFSGEATECVLGNNTHFHSIFNNIILNARDALLEVQDERSKEIRLLLDENGVRQIITITDNANGILPEHLAKLFQPFFSTKPLTGTGLGLSFVSKIIPLYQGTIDLTTDIGKGTTFTLSFPTNSKK